MMCLWRVSRHRSFLVWELSILKHKKKKKKNFLPDVVVPCRRAC